MAKISHPKNKTLYTPALQMLYFWFVAKRKNIGFSLKMGV
jgi:hypothetical protein